MSSLLASTQQTYPASLLLYFDGSNNSTTFTDSSIYNHTGTVYGTAKISTSQSKFGGSSGYFDSAGDYIQYSANTAFGFGTGSFTIEFWLYMISSGSTQGIISIGDYTNGILFRHQSTANLDSFYIAGTAYDWKPSSNCLISQWNHIAITRENGNFSIYVNGFKVLYGYNNSDLGSTRNVTIGASSHSTSQGLDGYIDGLRVTKGVALYTGISFALPYSSPSKNATIAPKLNNHIVITSTKSSGNISGNITTSSGYYTVNWYDGTKTTYSSGSSFSKAAVGGNQFITIYPSLSNGSLDGYFYNVDVSNNNLTSVRPLYSRFTESLGTPGYSQYFYNSYYSRGYTWIPGIPAVDYRLDVSSNLLDSSALNQIYTDLLNGNGTIDVSDNTGGDSDNPSIATAKGYTVYGSLSPYTTLLLNLNSNYTDSSSQNVSISVLGGSPAFSTSIKKYGSAALSCNGGNVGNDSLVIPDLSQVDYTIEFWIYRPTATAAYEGVINLSNGSGSTGINIHLYTSNDIHFNNGQAGAVSGGTINAAQWYHVACVSRNNVKKLFIDGTLVSSATQATPAGPYKIKIGSTYGLGQTSNAYIDDVRIIKGAAIYSSNFTPPASQLTVYP